MSTTKRDFLVTKSFSFIPEKMNSHLRRVQSEVAPDL